MFFLRLTAFVVITGVSWLPTASALGQSVIPSWFGKPPPLPGPTGQVIRATTSAELVVAVDKIQTGGTILIAEGEYRLPRPIIFSHKTNVTVRSAANDPTSVILKGKGWDSGDAKGDDIFHIGSSEGVIISGLTFADCRSYGIKVEAENSPRNIHIYHCRFRNIGVRAIKGSADQDPNRRAVKGSVRFCVFENDRVPNSDWLYGGDYIAGIDMMALEDWTFSDNVFRNIKGRNGGGRAAIFIWVRSRKVVVERNFILDCDRGISFGNPGQSTANVAGEQPPYVAEGVIRNNFIAGGSDCGIELWYAQDIEVAHNSIWRPERNWARGIRVGAGTKRTVLVNNLVHGEIRVEGGEARMQNNLSDRLSSYFEDGPAGDLRLTVGAVRALDAGLPLPGVTEDIRHLKRGSPPDLGAWEIGAK